MTTVKPTQAISISRRDCEAFHPHRHAWSVSLSKKSITKQHKSASWINPFQTDLLIESVMLLSTNKREHFEVPPDCDAVLEPLIFTLNRLFAIRSSTRNSCNGSHVTLIYTNKWYERPHTSSVFVASILQEIKRNQQDWNHLWRETNLWMKRVEKKSQLATLTLMFD